MKQTTKPNRKKNRIASGTWTTAAVLFLCVVLSATVAFSNLKLFIESQEPDASISLSPAEGEILSALSQTGESAVPGADPSASNSQAQDTSALRAHDASQTWSRSTDIDLFRAVHENENGVVTAVSGNGENIVAPGTANRYLFHLTNDGDAALDYEMNVSAVLSDSLAGYTIPVQVRLSDETGAWLRGAEDAWDNVSTLNGTVRRAVLGPRSYSSYLLEWEWPYDAENDELDSLLGNLAVADDLRLTVHFQVSAQYHTDPEAAGGIPQTGNGLSTALLPLLVILLLALLAAAATALKRYGRA